MRHTLTQPGRTQPARAAVLTGLLFLIVGVLGMHVLPGAHNDPGHPASQVSTIAAHAAQPLPASSPAAASDSALSQEVAPASSAAQPAEGETAGAMMTVCQPTVADPDWLIPPDTLGATPRPDDGTSAHTGSLTTQIIRPPSLIQLSITRT